MIRKVGEIPVFFLLRAPKKGMRLRFEPSLESGIKIEHDMLVERVAVSPSPHEVHRRSADAGSHVIVASKAESAVPFCEIAHVVSPAEFYGLSVQQDPRSEAMPASITKIDDTDGGTDA
jgi:hypothetical protein